MKRGLLTFVLLLLCGCVNNLPLTRPTPKYMAGQLLKVKEGFYSPCEFRPETHRVNNDYVVYQGDAWCPGVGYITAVFREDDLEPIK